MVKENNEKFQILRIYNFDEKKFKDLFKQIFEGETWAKIFLEDSHHGFVHGNQVRESCLKLVENLNPTENTKLLTEGRYISKEFPYESVVASIQIAAIFHDCGRFNDDGKIIKEEQKNHQRISAKRAIKFCKSLGLCRNLIKIVTDAVLCHDFQSKKLTPNMKSPETIVGKIVQSSDQMGWFHPNSLQRTLDYNKALGLPFFNSSETINERIEWVPNSHNKDALTVMLSQLFGPTGPERFGIESARKKVESYKKELKKGILTIAKQNNVEIEVDEVIKEYEKAKLKLNS